MERPPNPVKVPIYRSRRVRIWIACAIVVTLLISGSVVAYLWHMDNFPKRMSALDARKVADRTAQLNNVTMPLCSIDALGWPQNGDIDEKGRSTLWNFIYQRVDRDNDTWEKIVITVHAEGTPELSYYKDDAANAHSIYELRNFKIDSTAAFKTAIESPAVKKYKSEHSGEYLIGFGVVFNPDYNRIIWVIGWRDEGFIDEPTSRIAVVDANDGRLL